VICSDPEGEYSDQVDHLNLPGVRVLRVAGNGRETLSAGVAGSHPMTDPFSDPWDVCFLVWLGVLVKFQVLWV
jgi:hypothetical protein